MDIPIPVSCFFHNSLHVLKIPINATFDAFVLSSFLAHASFLIIIRFLLLNKTQCVSTMSYLFEWSISKAFQLGWVPYYCRKIIMLKKLDWSLEQGIQQKKLRHIWRMCLVHHTMWKDKNSVRQQRTLLFKMIQKEAIVCTNVLGQEITWDIICYHMYRKGESVSITVIWVTFSLNLN